MVAQMLAAPVAGVALAASATAQVADADRQDVTAVLARYKSALTNADGKSAGALFAPNAQCFENGKREGTFAEYYARHLGPELAAFKSFTFSDETVDVQIEGVMAFATETHRYRIVTGAGEAIERQGVATSVLRKIDGRWLIVSMHASSRKPRAA